MARMDHDRDRTDGTDPAFGSVVVGAGRWGGGNISDGRSRLGRHRLLVGRRKRLAFDSQLRFGSFGCRHIVEGDDEAAISFDVVFEFGCFDVGAQHSCSCVLTGCIVAIGSGGWSSNGRRRLVAEGFQERRTGRRRLVFVRDAVGAVAGRDVEIAQASRQQIGLVHANGRRFDERHVLRLHVVDGRGRHRCVEHAAAGRRHGSSTARSVARSEHSKKLVELSGNCHFLSKYYLDTY